VLKVGGKKPEACDVIPSNAYDPCWTTFGTLLLHGRLPGSATHCDLEALLQAQADCYVELPAEVEAVTARLAELHSVLVEGGLSGVMRKQGAETVAQAQALFWVLSSDIMDLSDRLKASDARLAAVRAALDGSNAGTVRFAPAAAGSMESGEPSIPQEDSAGSLVGAGESSEWTAPAAE
jgi:hypothetical protein